MELAADATSLQSCLTLCDPKDGSPPGSPVPGILQARTLEWVAIAFSVPRANSLENTLILGKIEGRKRRGQQRMIWLDDIIHSVDMNLSKLWETVKDREARHAAVYGITKWNTMSD